MTIREKLEQRRQGKGTTRLTRAQQRDKDMDEINRAYFRAFLWFIALYVPLSIIAAVLMR